MEITINQEQRLFCINSGEHISTYGFDYIFDQCMELAKRIKQYKFLKEGQQITPILPSQKGTPEQYQQYRDFIAIVNGRKMGTWFSYQTPAAVRHVLEQYRKEGGNIRVFYGDKLTGRCWMEENDVIGSVGRITGQFQCPFLVPPNEHGVSGILDSSIVRIIDADTREELYRHKQYNLPEMEIRPVETALLKSGYSHGVWVKNTEGNFENHANFKTFGKAAQWVAFMSGECTEQPD